MSTEDECALPRPPQTSAAYRPGVVYCNREHHVGRDLAVSDCPHADAYRTRVEHARLDRIFGEAKAADEYFMIETHRNDATAIMNGAAVLGWAPAFFAAFSAVSSDEKGKVSSKARYAVTFRRVGAPTRAPAKPVPTTDSSGERPRFAQFSNRDDS